MRFSKCLSEDGTLRDVPTKTDWRRNDKVRKWESSKLYSAKLCKYITDWDYVRSVPKSNILIKDFVYYCIVQDSALYVLWLL